LAELYRAWRAAGLSDAAIAHRLEVGEKLVRRLRKQGAATESGTET
jgi:hypothetical protein